jgi:hypothetical protein
MEYRRVTVPAASLAAVVDAARAKFGLGHIKLPDFLAALCSKVSAVEFMDWLALQEGLQIEDVTRIDYVD